MLGGGTFTTQDRVIPGAYMNFVSAARSGAAMSERGIVAISLTMSWGPARKVCKITAREFRTDSMSVLGYSMDRAELLPFRELLKNAETVLFYRLNGDAVKASNKYGEARYGGLRGNEIRLVIQKNVDDNTLFDVKTYVEAMVCDRQTVSGSGDLKDNDFVVFKKDVPLEETAGMEMTGGTDGGPVNGEAYQDFLDKIQSSGFHTLACDTADASTKNLFTAFTKRMRDDMGLKFQTVLFQAPADYEGVISVENKCTEKETGLVYWTAGASAGCSVNASNTNRLYDGEYTVDTGYKQSDLEKGIQAGKFMFHQVGDDVRVLSDVNTFVSFTEEKGRDFSENQTIRVLDQVGNDIASLFSTKYLGTVPNNESGRVSFWDDVVTYNKSLVKIHAIEDVDAKTIKVSAGKTKRAVVVENPIRPVNCMEVLYMTVVVQ